MAIPQHFIQDLLARTDIVELVGRQVQLKKSGANFSGLCPFHSEKTPSFTVSPTKQFYHCFGCGRHGNAIGFLIEHTGSGFVEAVQELAQQYGLEVPDDGNGAAERERAARERARNTTLTEVLQRASAAYYDQLKQSRPAIDYLKQRGVSGRTAHRFGLGWAAAGWHGLASVFPDYTDPLLEQAGLVVVAEDETARRYDRFRARLMFPIRNVKGEIIAFGGRVLDDSKPKYLNSPETPVFHKGHELYGLHEARQAIRASGNVLVVEGYMDVVVLAQFGVQNAVATLGTACTAEHVHKLFRHTESIVFCFDGDVAGRQAAHKAMRAALPYATDTRSLKFLFLPAEHDPDSFVRAEGADALLDAMKQATPLSQFLLEHAAQDCDMQSAEGRSRFAAQAEPLWKLLPTGALARQLLGDIAIRVQISAQELEHLWKVTGQGSGAAPARQRADFRRPLAPPGGRMRVKPPARAQRALQIALTLPETWQSLSAEDQQLLCGLPDPHGALFVWLDRQVQEHGPQPWSALREALRGEAQEDYAVHLVQQLPDEIQPDPNELQAILRQERPSDLKTRMNEALAAGDLAVYQELLAEYTAISMQQSEG